MISLRACFENAIFISVLWLVLVDPHKLGSHLDIRQFGVANVESRDVINSVFEIRSILDHEMVVL